MVAKQEQDEAGGGDGDGHPEHDERDVVDDAPRQDGLRRREGSSIKSSWRAITTAANFDLAERAMMACARCSRTVSIGSCMVAATSTADNPSADSCSTRHVSADGQASDSTARRNMACFPLMDSHKPPRP